MKKIIVTLTCLLVAPLAFAQNCSYAKPDGNWALFGFRHSNCLRSYRSVFQTTVPVGVKGYLDNVIGNSKDHKFHMTVNGKDLPLTPVKFHEEQKLGAGKSAMAVDMKGELGAGKSAMAVDMKGVVGNVYEIDFVTSGGVVTDGKIRKINGKAL